MPHSTRKGVNMAKVNAPLFSFGASGQLGKALVYFPWKGLDVVRSYTVPANPNTAAQQTQRGYMNSAVDEYHLAKYVAADKTAWDRYAGAGALPMSGFNAFCKSFIDLKLAAVVTVDPGHAGAITQSGAGQFDITVTEDGEADAVNCIWGYSKTALINTQALGEVVNVWTSLNVAAVSGSRVYGRMVIKLAGNTIGETGLFQVDIL